MPQVESLNIEERRAIEELEIRMKNALPPTLSQDDTVFYRFLRARDFDIDKAEKMLRKTIEWRKIFQVDNILTDFKPKEVFVKHLEPDILGYDKDGDAIVYTPVGRIVGKDVVKGIKMNDLMMHILWFGEKAFNALKEHSKQTRRDANRIILIFDAQDLTLSNAACKISLEILLRLAHMAQDNYPERLKTVYMINCPSYYMIIYSLIKRILSKHMLRKMRPFGTSGWKEELLEAIDPDVLPGFLGGNRTDPDGNPDCKTFVKRGGKIPSIYYLSTSERYFKDANKVKKAFIPPLEKKELYIEVPENGSRIHWRFYVKGKDIGFGLSIYISGQDVKELLPVERFSTTDGTEEGSYRCKSSGKYVAIFDNSYSWLNSKEVEYHVMVTKDK